MWIQKISLYERYRLGDAPAPGISIARWSVHLREALECLFSPAAPHV